MKTKNVNGAREGARTKLDAGSESRTARASFGCSGFLSVILSRYSAC